MSYTVNHYLKMLSLAGRTDQTVALYRKNLRWFAGFLDVPLDDLHNHLSTENLIDYAESTSRLSPSGRSLRLSILRRYYEMNGVQFHELEANVLKRRVPGEPDDKPLTHDMLVKMVDLADVRGRAVISMLVSTGMRTGEIAGIELSDIDGDTIHIRPEVTHQQGRRCYLSSEAREYLNLWLKNRPRHLAQIGNLNLYRKRAGWPADKRVFCASDSTIRYVWTQLYNQVDGEQGKYRAKCTPHSARRYFRTQAVRSMPLDLVERIMGHEGYLSRSYVRIDEEEARRLFHEGEAVLYITRRDQRVQDSALELERQKRIDLEREVEFIKAALARKQDKTP